MSNLEARLESAKARLEKANQRLAEEKERLRSAKKVVKTYESKIKRRERTQQEKERIRRLILLGSNLENIIGGEIDLDKWNEYINQYQGALKHLRKK